MTIIANDGHSVKPRTVDTLIATSGERYDFILEANQTVGNYWIRLRATGPCNIDRVETFAVLSYRDKKEISDLDLSYPKHPVPKFDDNFPPGIVSWSSHCSIVAFNELLLIAVHEPSQCHLLSTRRHIHLQL